MAQDQKAAYVNAQTMMMRCEIEGMLAENTHRISCGLSIAYGADAFDALRERYQCILAERVDADLLLLGSNLRKLSEQINSVAERVGELEKRLAQEHTDRCPREPAPCPADCQHKKALEWLVVAVDEGSTVGWRDEITQACDLAGLPYPWSKSDE